MQRRFLFTLMLCLMLAPVCARGAQSSGDMVAEEIRERIEGGGITGGLSEGTCQVSSLRVLPEIYKRRGYRPIWVKAQSVEQLLEAIQEIYHDGLDPKDYHLEEIRSLLAQTDTTASSDPSLAASRDLLLTDAFILLANHSACGKEDPLTHHPQWNLDRKIDGSDPVMFIEKAIEAPSLMQAIDAWKTRHPYYGRLKAALADYRAIRARGGWARVPTGPALRKGRIDPRIAALRGRLAITDHLSKTPGDPMTFDGRLEQALKNFQRRHGLKPDGVLGKATLQALNVPVEDRIDQIRVNLERTRWVLRDPDSTYVLVDIAGFHVFFLKDNQVVWSSRAQVGKPYRDTPVFRSIINFVEFNPVWTVPKGIFEKDILPAVRKDPRYLGKKGITIMDRSGRAVNPKTIDWSLYPGRPFPYKLRQNPGPNNALGRIKIVFPNEYLVYLHDTPSKELFEKEDRAFSSGCIRVEKPFELAELLLDDPSIWSLPNIMAAVDSKKTKKVFLPRPVPIMLQYWTVEVDETGVISFKKDPYNQDVSVLKGLGRDAGITPVP